MFITMKKHTKIIQNKQELIEILEEQISSNIDTIIHLQGKLQDAEDHLIYYREECSQLRNSLRAANNIIAEIIAEKEGEG